MLPNTQTPRKPAARCPFRTAPWDDSHPECQRLDRDLPPDHTARLVVAFVAQLDLGPLRRAYAGYGALAYPPEQLLPFLLWQHFQGELSPAHWVRQARFDDQARWLLRGLRPSRSLWYTFRDRTGPFLLAWHQQLLTWACAQGVTTATRSSGDGSLVASLASRHRLVGRRTLTRRLFVLRRAVWLDQNQDQAEPEPLPEDWLAWLLSFFLWLDALGKGLPAVPPPPLPPLSPAWLPKSVRGRARVLARHEQAWQQLQQRRQPLLNKHGPLSKKEQKTLKNLKVSLTDPEAVLGRDQLGVYRPLYNLGLLQATDAPLTLAWEVVASANDQGLLRSLVTQGRQQTDQRVQEVLSDGGLLNVSEAVWCEQEKVVLYVPPTKASAAAAQGQAAPAGGSKRAQKYPKDRFRYDAAQGVYFCPQGKPLTPSSQHSESRQGKVALPVFVYRAAAADCQACPVRSQCTSSPKGRVVKRYQGEEALERLHSRMQTPANQEVYAQRGRTVELGYADAKEHRSLRAFRCLGQQRSRTQAGLTLLASNGVSICRALQRRVSQAVLPAWSERPPSPPPSLAAAADGGSAAGHLEGATAAVVGGELGASAVGTAVGVEAACVVAPVLEAASASAVVGAPPVRPGAACVAWSGTSAGRGGSAVCVALVGLALLSLAGARGPEAVLSSGWVALGAGSSEPSWGRSLVPLPSVHDVSSGSAQEESVGLEVAWVLWGAREARGEAGPGAGRSLPQWSRRWPCRRVDRGAWRSTRYQRAPPPLPPKHPP